MNLMYAENNNKKCNITLDTIVAQPGDTVSFHLIANSNNNYLRTFGLKIKYDTTVLSFKGIKNINNNYFNKQGGNDSLLYININDNVNLIWSRSDTTGVYFTKDTLFELEFVYKGGTDSLGFLSESLVVDSLYNYFDAQYNKGFIGPIAIRRQPKSIARCEGSSAEFSIVADSKVAMTYQWYKNDSLVSGATQSLYSIDSLNAADAGSYKCIATNVYGSLASKAAILEVNTMPPLSTSTLMSPSEDVISCTGTGFEINITQKQSGTFSYEWFKNDSLTKLSGETAAFTIDSIALADTGYYFSRISNACGSIFTDTIKLDVNEAPVITGQPISGLHCAGSSIQLKITAIATDSLSFQWYKNDSLLTNALDSVLNIPNSTIADAGIYKCIVSNSLCSVTSDTAKITIIQGAPSIVQQPVQDTICSGMEYNIAVSVSADSLAPLTYQWFRNDTLINGASNSTFNIQNSALTDAGYYRCNVSNLCGGVMSNTVLLSVNSNTPPTITLQPESIVECPGSTVSFRVNVTGTAPLAFQWYKNDTTIISGANDSLLVLENISDSDTLLYHCVISNTCKEVHSEQAKLYLIKQNLSILQQPADSIICNGGGASFTISATGAYPLTYQWYKNDTILIEEAVDSTLTLNSAATASPAIYKCQVTDLCNTATSNSASLTVYQPPVITGQPQAAKLCAGSEKTFSISVDSETALSYQWFKKAYNQQFIIEDATNSMYSIQSITEADTGFYKCVVSNTCGIVTSEEVYLGLKYSPEVLYQPGSAKRCEGSNYTFKVTPTGSDTVSYQWYKDYNLISGAEEWRYRIDSLTIGDAGNYYCVITNGCGNVSSDTVSLVIQSSFNITGILSDTMLCSGDSLSFNLSTNSSRDVYYRWYRYNQISEEGLNDSILTLNNISEYNTGYYRGTAANACGYKTSNEILLDVHTPPVIETPEFETATMKLSGQLVLQYATDEAEVGFRTCAKGTFDSDYDAYKMFNQSQNLPNIYTYNDEDEALAINSQPPLNYGETFIRLGFNVKDSGDFVIKAKDIEGFNIYTQIYLIDSLTNQSINLRTTTEYNFAMDTATGNDRFWLRFTAYDSTGNRVNEQPCAGSVNCPGSGVSYRVRATGTEPLSYQWYKNDALIDEATYSTFNIQNSTLADTGSYYCIVSNSCGVDTSRVYNYEITAPVEIINQPVSDIACFSSVTHFSIDSIRPLDELVTGNGEAYPWLSLDGNRIYYIKGCDYGWFNTGNWFDMSFENGDVTNCTKYGIFNYVPQQKTELSITGSTFESNNIGIGQEQGVLTLKCNHI